MTTDPMAEQTKTIGAGQRPRLNAGNLKALRVLIGRTAVGIRNIFRRGSSDALASPVATDAGRYPAEDAWAESAKIEEDVRLLADCFAAAYTRMEGRSRSRG
jgi:hypothetical protein